MQATLRWQLWGIVVVGWCKGIGLVSYGQHMPSFGHTLPVMSLNHACLVLQFRGQRPCDSSFYFLYKTPLSPFPLSFARSNYPLHSSILPFLTWSLFALLSLSKPSLRPRVIVVLGVGSPKRPPIGALEACLPLFVSCVHGFACCCSM